MTNSLRICSISLFLMLLQACSTHIPPEIRVEPVGAPSVAKVREQLDAHVSQKVRWGGKILSLENQTDSSRAVVISLPLSRNGRPKVSDISEGRFIAIIDEFLEPLVYSRDRHITVTGQIVRSETIKVGEFMYEYPVVEVDHYYLWPKRVKPVHPRPYGYYDLWFYHDYYPWPYRYPYPYRIHRLEKK